MLNLIEADPERTPQYLRVARISTRLMLSLVNDMLDFSSIVSRKFTKKIQRFELRPALSEATDLVRYMIEEKGLRLLTSFDQFLPCMVSTDKDRLCQVLINLLSNAYKYTPEGQIELSVDRQETEDEESAPMLQVNVKDTGIGIKEQDASKLFNMFSRLSEGS